MVYAVHGLCGFNTTVRRDLVFTNLTARLAGENTWGPRTVTKVTSPEGDPALSIEARYVLKAAADLFWTDLVAELGLPGPTAPRPGSSIWRHDCAHDAARPTPCVVSDQVVW